MKSEISQRVNHELVDKWSSEVLNVWPLDTVVRFKSVCAELSRRSWGEDVIAHLYDLVNLKDNSDRYVAVSKHKHTADTWAATMWGLYRLGLTDLVELLRDCTNTPAQVRCPICGKFMRQGYDKSYTNIQGIEEFRHGCTMFRNKAIRLFRYVPDHGWSECGKRNNKPHYDKATKDRIESLLWHIINGTSQRAVLAADWNFSEADKRHTEVCKAKNELYDIFGMEEYKYDV